MRTELANTRLAFEQLVGNAFRITADTEGLPAIEGRYGRIEWHDHTTLAGYTGARLMRSRLLALPGLRRHQVGDTEARALFGPEALPAVAALLRCRRRRSAAAAAHLVAHAYRSSAGHAEGR